MHFSFSQKSEHLNGLFTQERVKSMLEGKDYKSINIVFQFMAGLTDSAVDCVEQTPLMTIHTTFSKFLGSLMFDRAAAIDTSRYHPNMESHTQDSNRPAKSYLGL